VFNDKVLDLNLFRLREVAICTASIGEMRPTATLNRISMREKYGILGALLMI
jgi:hypothetical protein